ncbi:MAG: glycosyltransferase [Bacteroidetes bacterium]|nr:glycosyltransferase [Bacteroidota bacterium]
MAKKAGNHLTNFVDIVENCHGKYIALLDGDDMWTDTNKLQQQVDFLDKNPDYVMSCHYVRYLNEEQGTFKFPDMSFSQAYDTYTLDDLLKGNFITTCSVVFRNNYQIPNWFTQLSVGDWPLYIILCGLSKGKIHCLNQYLATYRIHTGGVFSLQTKISQVKRLIDVCGILLKQNNFLDYNQQRLLRKLEAEYHLQLLSTIHTKTIDRKTRLKWFFETVKRIKYFSSTEFRYLLVYFLDTLTNRK